jgi:hypothetical protein
MSYSTFDPVRHEARRTAWVPAYREFCNDQRRNYIAWPRRQMAWADRSGPCAGCATEPQGPEPDAMRMRRSAPPFGSALGFVLSPRGWVLVRVSPRAEPAVDECGPVCGMSRKTTDQWTRLRPRAHEAQLSGSDVGALICNPKQVIGQMFHRSGFQVRIRGSAFYWRCMPR